MTVRATDPRRSSDRLPSEGTYRCLECRRPMIVFSETRRLVRACGYCGGDSRRVG